MNVLERLPAKLPMGLVLSVSLLFSGLLGLIDHITGYELSFSIFYLAPVAFTSWYGNKRSCLAIALVSAVVWLTVDATAGHQYKSYLILVWNSGVRFGFFIIVAYLLAAVKESLTREKRNSRVDQLTGVLNMKGFMEEAETLWELARRHHHPTAVGYIDLDNFKEVNDSFGHAEGDYLLKAVAAAMKTSLRSTDVLGRLGGDEFAAFLPETGNAGAEEVFRKTREALFEVASNHNWPITASIGAAIVTSSYSVSFTDLLKYSDELMYIAKEKGKNNIFSEEFKSNAAERNNQS